MESLFYLIITMNIISFAVYAYDKFAAINNRWRISEKNLFILALLFGGVGATLSMKIFRHKTQKPLFLLLIPILTALQLVAIATLYGVNLN
ncbi:DUF1294 domain-containing protein [Ezakiella peruensis]|uniref:DUF1294 domain-containing protein n=1 Tax=Ezakiella peruensis TaxID=1464038 RepID=UPI000C1B47C7|nr:DUF1294 domain-containing protein [Ezakiella peruensis]